MTIGEYRKVGFIKVGEKTSAISETSTFSTWPKWRFVFRRSFCLTQKGNFKNVEIEAKNGDLGLGHSHGSKRPLLVTEDFAEEDGELAAHHHQETFDADVLSLSGLEELELTFGDVLKARRRRMVMMKVNVTRDEHDVDNVNDDDFYILNKNDYDPSQACSTEEHQSAMNLFAKPSPT